MQIPARNRSAPTTDAGSSTLAPAGIATPAVPTRTDEVLSVADLTKSFRTGLLRRRLKGIEGVSFTVRRGEIFALLGHNGAGKTTTINCLLNLCHPDAGRVRLLGRDSTDAGARCGVGYLPERPYFFEHLTGRELLRFYGELLDLPRSRRDDEVERVLTLVGMAGAAERRLRKLSKGMLQRLGLAQALLGDPDLLILDEPMSGLDPLGRREVRELLSGLRAEGRTILLSSHIVPDVEMLADTVAILRNGRVARTCNREEIAAGASYLVHTAAPGPVADRWPAWLQEAAPEVAGSSLRIPAADTAMLRYMLEHCHRDDLAVRSVETRRTGLEDLFLSVHNLGGGA